VHAIEVGKGWCCHLCQWAASAIRHHELGCHVQLLPARVWVQQSSGWTSTAIPWKHSLNSVLASFIFWSDSMFSVMYWTWHLQMWLMYLRYDGASLMFFYVRYWQGQVETIANYDYIDSWVRQNMISSSFWNLLRFTLCDVFRLLPSWDPTVLEAPCLKILATRANWQGLIIMDLVRYSTRRWSTAISLGETWYVETIED